MERLIFDTSVLISLEREQVPNTSLAAPVDDVAIAAISAAEILEGVENSSGRRRAARERFIEGMLSSFQVLPYDLTVARTHAVLSAAARRAGGQRQVHDLMIAATASTHSRTVITLDKRGFSDLPGVRVRTPHGP